MGKSHQENELKEVLSKVFDTDIVNITEDASPDTVDSWDSLRHLNLVLALEEAFDIEFTEDQTIEIASYQLIKTILKEHGIAFQN